MRRIFYLLFPFFTTILFACNNYTAEKLNEVKIETGKTGVDKVENMQAIAVSEAEPVPLGITIPIFQNSEIDHWVKTYVSFLQTWQQAKQQKNVAKIYEMSARYEAFAAKNRMIELQLFNNASELKKYKELEEAMEPKLRQLIAKR